VATPAPEAAQRVHHSPEERAVDGADDPTGATARQGSRPRPTTARVGPYREAEDVALLLGLSGHRDPRRMTHTASARQSTLPAVLNLLWRMARVSLLGDPATGSATTWKRGCPGRTATPCPERGISPERGSLPVAPQIAPFWPLIRSTGPRSRALATMSVWPRLAEVPLGDVPDGRAEMTGGRYPRVPCAGAPSSGRPGPQSNRAGPGTSRSGSVAGVVARRRDWRGWSAVLGIIAVALIAGGCSSGSPPWTEALQVTAPKGSVMLFDRQAQSRYTIAAASVRGLLTAQVSQPGHYLKLYLVPCRGISTRTSLALLTYLPYDGAVVTYTAPSVARLSWIGIDGKQLDAMSPVHGWAVLEGSRWPRDVRVNHGPPVGTLVAVNGSDKRGGLNGDHIGQRSLTISPGSRGSGAALEPLQLVSLSQVPPRMPLVDRSRLPIRRSQTGPASGGNVGVVSPGPGSSRSDPLAHGIPENRVP